MVADEWLRGVESVDQVAHAQFLCGELLEDPRPHRSGGQANDR
jgi:hypothetical protein